MRRVSIREARTLLPRLEQELAAGGEIVLTRHGRPIARVSALEPEPAQVSTANLRAQIPPVRVPSEALIRQDRDER